MRVARKRAAAATYGGEPAATRAALTGDRGGSNSSGEAATGGRVPRRTAPAAALGRGHSLHFNLGRGAMFRRVPGLRQSTMTFSRVEGESEAATGPGGPLRVEPAAAWAAHGARGCPNNQVARIMSRSHSGRQYCHRQGPESCRCRLRGAIPPRAAHGAGTSTTLPLLPSRSLFQLCPTSLLSVEGAL